MSFTLHVFHGNIDDDETRWRPLDVEKAGDFIASLPDAEIQGDEVLWPVSPDSVEFFLGARSVAATIRFGPDVPRAESRENWRQILTALFGLAELLDAKVGDTGVGRVLDAKRLEDEVDRYAGREDDPLPPRAEPIEPRPTWPPLDFEAMTEVERQRYFEEYLAGAPAGIERLRAATAGAPGLTLDSSPDSLRPLWPWMLEVAEVADPSLRDRSQVPMWAHELVRGLTVETIWLIDALAYYLAEVILRNVSGTYWRIASDLAGSIQWGQPIIGGLETEFRPVGAVSTMVVTALEDPNYPPRAPRGAPDALYQLYKSVESDAVETSATA